MDLLRLYIHFWWVDLNGELYSWSNLNIVDPVEMVDQGTGWRLQVVKRERWR